MGVLLRNQPAHIGLLAGLLLAGACVVTINPGRGEDRVRADVAGLGVPVLAGSPADLAAFAPRDADAAVATEGTAPLLLAAADLGESVTASGKPPSGPLLAGQPDSAVSRCGVAVEMLTSGTTGTPKGVPRNRIDPSQSAQLLDDFLARKLKNVDQNMVAREINKVVVSQAREFVWGTSASQLSFVRKYMAMAPEHVLVTVQQEQEALTAIRGEHKHD